MSTKINPNSGLIFMKVGLHSGETFEQILERKKIEYEKAGSIFWGYGGGTCHPLRMVQPFAKMTIREGKGIYLVMSEINSHHPPTSIIAKEFSEDGLTWKPIPNGIEVRGSRYALVLDELHEGDLDLDLNTYKVAAGPSTGKIAAGYIGGRVDKACIEPAESYPSDLEPEIKKIQHFAKMKAPFAVFLR